MENNHSNYDMWEKYEKEEKRQTWKQKWEENENRKMFIAWSPVIVTSSMLTGCVPCKQKIHYKEEIRKTKMNVD